MKRRITAFVVMLVAVLVVKLGMPVLAEMTLETGEGLDVTLGYCEGREAPVSALITKELPTQAEGEAEVTWTSKEFPYTTPYGQSHVARAVVTMAAGREASGDEWQQLSDDLADIISRAIPNAERLDAGEMAEKIWRAIDSVRRDAKPDETGKVPLLNDPKVVLSKLSIEAPYYPTLRRGDKSDEVKTLQQKLIELGYLVGAADGQFGAMTETAVMDVEKALRSIEQAAIDALPTPTPVQVPTPAPGETLSATAAPEPAGEPAPKPEPATAVDGVVDLALQIRLNSDEFPLVAGDLAKGSDAQAVTRLQRRLLQLGCLTGAADGDYGANTRRGVTIFQHYNGLEETGVADEATQRRIFSSAAQAPANPLLTEGVEGEEVKKLQTRLIGLGFMKGTPDGSYGNATVAAVKEMQTYLREKEIARLTAAANADHGAPEDTEVQPGATAAPTDAEANVDENVNITPTIEVNGVADPLLLDTFYANDFETSALKNGDENLDVKRVQKRLNHLEYLYGTADGAFGDATETAVRDFQKRNSLPQDGIAGQATLDKLFGDFALKALKPYVLKVSIDKQRVYAYGLDANNEHTELVRTMKCSTGSVGTPTPKGTYQATTGPGARWHYFKKFTCWAQYAYYIEGDYMFHSVLYGSKGGPVTSSSVRNLGSRASHGCVRLTVEDAKWLYTNCPPNTKVIIY